MFHADVVREPIDPVRVLSRVGSADDGAVLLFLGVVRNHAEGRAVEGITYDAYEAMARDVLSAIAAEAADLLGTDRIAVVH
ncbi:MAG: molybdenum cofactor biosynthesis protein MoaE, partial [Gemmatimonadetes bacterium]|nr:molybdenum cofactor biosynthesis protein MoaE [Gemmatimonadota bacterium]